MIPVFDSTWTLFLDRDGVINERIFGGYVTTPEEFHFTPNAEQAIAKFNEIFSKIVVVTNQQCVAKGVLTECNLLNLHSYMHMKLAESNAKIDKIYFAPELSLDPQNTRKPKPNMALQAKSDYPEIDFSKSVMVGDTDSDIVFGKNLRMFTVRVQTPEPIRIESDLTVQSLYEFSQIIHRK